MENAREEWDRAHSLKTKVQIPYKEYANLLKSIGLAVCEAEIILASKPNPKEWQGDLETFDKILESQKFDELEDNDLICEILEEPIVVDEEELDACYRIQL
jgi:hypothetical protein